MTIGLPMQKAAAQREAEDRMRKDKLAAKELAKKIKKAAKKAVPKVEKHKSGKAGKRRIGRLTDNRYELR